MKTQSIYGWAVIFTATLLLAACASHTPQVADTSMMSGPDETMTQPQGQKQTLEQRENAIVIRQAWLDERTRELDQRESALEQRENAVAIQQAWFDEREMQLDKREPVLERLENAASIQQAWLDEREAQLDKRSPELNRRENAVAIQQAWLDEREQKLGQRVADLERRENAVAIQQAWLDEKEMQFDQLAGHDSSDYKVDAGRCYASVFVPARYRTVAVTKPIDMPAGKTSPILTETVTERVKVFDAHTRWEEVLCESSLTQSRVVDIQQALHRSGYNPGPMDGIIGQQTMAAVKAFQKDSNLTVADYLTTETVEALGIDF